MSSYIMHICISDIIRKKYNLSKKYLYGCILPDLQKELGADRAKTHFTKRIEIDSTVRDLPQIEKAIKELKEKLEFEVYLGYISHLIEDYIWFNKYIPLYTKKINDEKVIYLKDNSSHNLDEYRLAIYADYAYFGKYVVDKCNTHIEDVINEINSICTKEEKELVIKNTKLNFNIEYKPILLYKESVDNYIAECIEKIDLFIIKNDIKQLIKL